MQNNSRHYSTLGASSFSRLASLGVWASLAFSAASGSNSFGATNLTCRVLKQVGGGVVNYGWFVDYGQFTGQPYYLVDIAAFPFLEHYGRSLAAGQYIYTPNGYASGQSPVSYVTSAGPDILLTDEQAPYADLILTSINQALPTWSERAAISSLSVDVIPPAEGDDKPTITLDITTKKVGTKQGNGLIVNDSSGNTVLAFPDETGLVSGYVTSPSGQNRQVWYDVSGPSVIRLDTLNNRNSSALSYDSETGLYSFNIPDYSVQLSAINESIKHITFDGITLPVPEVTVNPEITVNPSVTVPAPEVTVNVPAPEVTVNVPAPQVTVNPSVTVPAPEVTVNVDNDYSEIVSTLDQLVDASYSAQPSTNFSNETFTTEEQTFINTAVGWQTQIPVVGDAFDLGLNILIGKIPQMDKSYTLLNTQLLGYEVKCDLNDYKDTIMIFRAFFLLCELVWFFWVLWHDIMNALKV